MTALLCSISEKIFITHSSLNRNLFLLIIILHDRSDWFSSQLKQLQKCFCWDNYSALLCNRSALVLFLVSSHRIFFFNVTWRLRFNKINKKHRFIKDSLCFGLTAPGLCCCSQPFSRCGELVLPCSCRVWASHRSGFSCYGGGAGLFLTRGQTHVPLHW